MLNKTIIIILFVGAGSVFASEVNNATITQTIISADSAEHGL